MTHAPDTASSSELLLGDEAVALGALHAGIAAAYSYPGTPATEIFEFVQSRAADHGVVADWCANEKTAYEQALGVSLAGRRALVSMKHVGLNVAADPFVNSALVAIGGGLVVAVADDPGMHSSQNEQDSRLLADFARVPCLEPADPQQAYAMTREAFAVSERFEVPVMVRLVTRLSHGRAAVVPDPAERPPPRDRPDDPRTWVLVPANARRQWRRLLDRQRDIAASSEASHHNVLSPGAGRLGVVTSGVARNSYLENAPDLDEPPPHLHVGAYPAPEHKIRELAGGVDALLVLEEGYPYLERRLRGLLPTAWTIAGKESGEVPLNGELSPDTVRAALGLAPRPHAAPATLPPRPPRMCPGCPHDDSFAALRAALGGHDEPLVTGDIGCYALGAMPPHDLLETCVCMGAAIGTAKGAVDAGVRPVVAVIGDSTFLHSGVTALMDAAAADTDMTLLVLDNETVAMTGLQAPVLPGSRLAPIARGVGVDPRHVRVVDVKPGRPEELAAVLSTEMAHRGLSVVISVQECVEAAKHRRRATRAAP